MSKQGNQQQRTKLYRKEQVERVYRKRLKFWYFNDRGWVEDYHNRRIYRFKTSSNLVKRKLWYERIVKYRNTRAAQTAATRSMIALRENEEP